MTLGSFLFLDCLQSGYDFFEYLIANLLAFFIH